jgi:uncharacterized protein
MKHLVLGLLISFGLASSASAFTIPEKPTGYVNDYAKVLLPSTVENLDKQLSLFDASTTNQIVVVTVPDITGETIETEATKIFDLWKPGSKNRDNGVLLLISPNDHTARIEVGYGLEGALTDAQSITILNNEVFPEFKNGSYDMGVLKGVLAIAKATQGEYVSETKKVGGKETLVSGFMIGLILMQFFWRMLGMSRSWWLGGVIGGIGGALITATHAFGISTFLGVLLTFGFIGFGLLFDYFSSQFPFSGSGGGTGFGGWRTGSGGFGGFGGGRSGGGGASGTW